MRGTPVDHFALCVLCGRGGRVSKGVRVVCAGEFTESRGNTRARERETGREGVSVRRIERRGEREGDI
jgi:hypothetical protein